MFNKKKFFRNVFVVMALFVVMAGCGFRPLYKQDKYNNLLDKTSEIYIAPVQIFDGAWGVQLRNILLDKLTPYGKPTNPKYVLNILLSEPKESAYTIKDDGMASSYLVKVSAFYTLKRKNEVDILLKNNASSDISYNILKNQYSTEMLKSNAIKLAIENIANQIYFSIITYLTEN